jgi:hypothetical protein
VANTRVQLNRKAFRELRQSSEVLADLEARGRRIAAAAGPGHSVRPWVGKERARVTVGTDTFDARRAEATGRSLTRAVDAGR